MKFTKKYIKFQNPYWEGKRNNIKFTISCYGTDKFYVVADCSKSNEVFNSLWKEIVFDSLEEASEYCNSFKFE
jgi:hypothetical protein